MKLQASSPKFQTFECENPNCRLRFPNDLSVSQFDNCPRCGSPMKQSGEPYTNFQRPSSENLLPGYSFNIILDNLRSAQNVGSIFRTANGAGVKHIYCCGTTPTPDHSGVKKASLGAEAFTPWSYHPNSLVLAETLKGAGYYLLGIESTEYSVPLFSLYEYAPPQQNLALILGNEVSGVDPQVLAITDRIVHIPMAGEKTSINVAVTAGIALYWIIGQANRIC